MATLCKSHVGCKATMPGQITTHQRLNFFHEQPLPVIVVATDEPAAEHDHCVGSGNQLERVLGRSLGIKTTDEFVSETRRNFY